MRGPNTCSKEVCGAQMPVAKRFAGPPYLKESCLQRDVHIPGVYRCAGPNYLE